MLNLNHSSAFFLIEFSFFDLCLINSLDFFEINCMGIYFLVGINPSSLVSHLIFVSILTFHQLCFISLPLGLLFLF